MNRDDDRQQDEWIPPCDLCGGFSYETVASAPHAATVHRCRNCGLMTVTRAEGVAVSDGGRGGSMPVDLLTEAARPELEEGAEALLIIGEASEQLLEAARAAGGRITTRSLEVVLESRLPAESFDVVVVTEGLERVSSPARLFEQVRLWLRPGGTLLVGTWNTSSLPARIRRRSWLRRQGGRSAYLMNVDHIRRYALRYGFRVTSVRTRAHTGEVASVFTGSDDPSWLMEMASVPLALASSLLGMGVIAVVKLSKGGLTHRPIRLELEEQAERNSGFAPAMFAGDS